MTQEQWDEKYDENQSRIRMISSGYSQIKLKKQEIKQKTIEILYITWSYVWKISIFVILYFETLAIMSYMIAYFDKHMT